MIIHSKFNIGQIVIHKLLGFSGIIIDIDPIYSLKNKNIKNNKKKKPWYHVLIEDNNGNYLHIYLEEYQLSWKKKEKYEKSSLNNIYKTIKKNKIKKNKLN